MDRNIFIGITAATLAMVFLLGDQMYVGIWYYIVIPFSAFILTVLLKPSSFYLTGVGLAILVSYTPYYWQNLASTNPEGLLGLGHVFSLPGFFLGIILSAFYLKNKGKSAYFAALIGFSGPLLGYVINQLVVCNSVMYCGSFLTRING